VWETCFRCVGLVWVRVDGVEDSNTRVVPSRNSPHANREGKRSEGGGVVKQQHRALPLEDGMPRYTEEYWVAASCFHRAIAAVGERGGEAVVAGKDRDNTTPDRAEAAALGEERSWECWEAQRE